MADIVKIINLRSFILCHFTSIERVCIDKSYIFIFMCMNLVKNGKFNIETCHASIVFFFFWKINRNWLFWIFSKFMIYVVPRNKLLGSLYSYPISLPIWSLYNLLIQMVLQCINLLKKNNMEIFFIPISLNLLSKFNLLANQIL